MSTDRQRYKGLFISLEGVDGSGKSTQASLLVEDLQFYGYDVVFVREPGGTVLSEQIRSIVLDPQNDSLCDECELLLYEASRAQLVKEVIEPALSSGKVVVCDRFYDSTFAYQSAGRGLEADLVKHANTLGSCGISPDRTLVYMLDPTVALSRATQNSVDRLEAEGVAFQNRVSAGYNQLIQEESHRVKSIDAQGSVEQVHKLTRDCLADLIPQMRELSE
ncbi:MAG: dTMP kinase [Atopobiaceae bacterium]|nr:dTMP kinase [Atopobiaceae bacterium]